jgi:DNA repair protein RadA/Sms
MARPRASYLCTQCGARLPKWAGRCPECGAWNSLEEVAAQDQDERFGGYAGTAGLRRLGEVEAASEPRLPTGLAELDRVLGGGLVAGSVVLIGGDPGIGKSTLLLQTLAALNDQVPALYVTGEESLQQVSLRAQRLDLAAADLRLLAETRVEPLIRTAEQHGPRVLVIDSIQTMYTQALSSAPGSVGQVRDSAARLVRFAKGSGSAVFLVGHVTREGTIAGPRVLEHMVDTVLYFEGEPDGRYRVLRAVKNRFGAVNELGVFAMTEHGLKPVTNPSAIFLSGHRAEAAGSVVLVAREGTRPLLVEVQALLDESHAPTPRRVCLGLDGARMAMLLAVLHRHSGVATFDQDVFGNVVGGVRVGETAADLAVLAAVLSSLRNRPLDRRLAMFGEVGLTGEVRPVPGGQERLREAAKQGFGRIILPRANAPRKPPAGLEVVAVDSLGEAMQRLWE